MKKILYLALVLVCAGLSSRAGGLDVACEVSGILHRQVSEPERVTSLTLHGVVDASDMDFIAKSMPALQSLDMSDVDILEYSGEPVNGHKRLAANTIPAGMFAAAPFSRIVFPKTPGLVIGDASFAGARLTGLDLPANVAEVGLGAFAACRALREVRVAADCEMDSHVFSGCTALEKVVLSERRTIPESAFEDCASLSEVEGETSACEIGRRAFAGCGSLKCFDFSPNLTAVGEEAFLRSGLQSVDMTMCTELREIAPWTFAKCGDMLDYRLPGGSGSLGAGAFFECGSLTGFAFATGIADIGDYAFKGVSSVPEVFLPQNVEYIGSYAMAGMRSLASVDVRALQMIPGLGENVWDGLDCGKIDLYTTSGMYAGYAAAAQWQDFNIKAMDGIDGTALSGNPAGLSAHFVGKRLHIDSSSLGAAMESVALYDAVGGVRLLHVPVGSATADIDTSDFGGAVFIAVCRLDGGPEHTVKLLRK